MPCERIGNTIICYSNGYKFKGYFFEWHNYFRDKTITLIERITEDKIEEILK